MPKNAPYVLVECSRVRRDPKQPREYFNEKEIAALAGSIKMAGQRLPALVKPVVGDPDHDFELIYGERRWIACTRLGRKLKVTVQEEELSPHQQLVWQVVENFGRAEQTPLETARAVERIKNGGPKPLTNEEVADIFAHGVQWVELYLRIVKLAPAVQQMLHPELPEEKQLAVHTASYLAPLPEEWQVRAAATIVAKRLSLVRARRYIRDLQLSLGLPTNGQIRERKPSDDFAFTRGQIDRMSDNLEMLLANPSLTFNQMFKHRDPKDKQQILEDLDKLMTFLLTLRDLIEGMKVRK